MQRREYLALGGALAASTVAGCNTDAEGDSTTPTETSAPTATETETPTETPTATETETPAQSDRGAELLEDADAEIEALLDSYASTADADSIVDVPPGADDRVSWFDGRRDSIRSLLDDALAQEYLSNDQIDDVEAYRTEVSLIGSFVSIQRGLYEVHRDAQWLLDRIQADNRSQARDAAGDIGELLTDHSLGSASEDAAHTAANNAVREEIEEKAAALEEEVATYRAMDDALDPSLDEAWVRLEAARDEYNRENWNSAQIAARDAYEYTEGILIDLDMDPAEHVADQYDVVWGTFSGIEEDARGIEESAAEEADS